MSVDSLTSVNSILSEEGSVTSVGSFSDVAVGGAEQTDAVGADRKAYDSLRKKINTDNDNGWKFDHNISDIIPKYVSISKTYLFPHAPFLPSLAS